MIMSSNKGLACSCNRSTAQTDKFHRCLSDDNKCHLRSALAGAPTHNSKEPKQIRIALLAGLLRKIQQIEDPVFGEAGNFLEAIPV